ncbi:hypothetical protein BsWGS_18112 [Bradybaena similaris]
MFQFDSKWDVDKAAESLNTSLFGKPKKHKLRESLSPASLDKSYASAILDSDDEQYTKKDRKKMKKRRKKIKAHDKIDEIDSTELNQSNETDSKVAGAKKNVKNSSKNVDNSVKKKKINVTPIKMEPNVINAKSKKVKRESRDQEPKLNTPSHENLMEKKSKKRKRSSSQSADDVPVIGSKKKMAKVEEHKSSAAASGDATESGEGKKKRKRNRKKKNNSKKNKYKHLALNSKSKLENSVIPHSNGLSSPNLEPTNEKFVEHSQNSNSDKSLGRMHKNTDISSIVTSSDSVAVVQKQVMNKSNHTDSLIMDSQVKKKKKKRKSNQNNQTEPTKKLKQGTSNSKDEVPIMSSNIKSSTIATKSGEQHSAKPNISAKSKMKQQVLLKLLTGAQIQKQDSSNVSKKIDSTTDKKKGKVLQENGSSANSKNIVEIGNKQEIISNDAHKKSIASASSESHSIWGKAAELGQQAKEKLDSARFRYINEQLYSCTGDDALKLFREDRAAFSVYHEGFQNQVNKWPVNPLDVFIKQLKDKPKNLVIADFGCGDAKLAQSVPQKVHSFDLVALNKRITVCDMSKTPLPGEHVDIAIFCLSLMGTNITDYVLEANRVLKAGGLLKIAEVVSRFSGLSRFVEGVCNCGFQLLNKRDTNQMFYLMDFKKIKPVKKSASVGAIKLKPCIYKRR